MKKLLNNLLENNLFRYIIIGGFSTFIHISVAFLFIKFIQNSIFLSNLSGFLVAFFFSYLMQSTFVFNHKINIKKASKYFVVQLLSLVISISIIQLIDFQNSYIKTILIVIILPFITYLAHKFWTFSEK